MVLMIEKTVDTAVSAASDPNQAGKKYHMVKNDRTAGSIPSYSLFDRGEVAQSSFREVLSDSQASAGRDIDFTGSEVSGAGEGGDFGFGDLVDMVNPLQHIPLVNLAYREITGDEIKPVGKIIGGGVFGGPVGMASGLVDAVIKDGTGKDMSGHALSLVEKEDRSSSYEKQSFENVEIAMDSPMPQDFQEPRDTYDDLPVSLLAFAEKPMEASPIFHEFKGISIDAESGLGSRDQQVQINNYVRAASGRTAGHIKKYI